ncbi:ferritin-like domain-containing protein [Desmospora profundinema]|uniref:Rubrerythrin n=1 Tax=Desmospora profundinema TaxID=1571184 RepID=A0ABU1II82_9BACL|nr:ferritin-like domain-containing protein [Desmospora profundinema]MDR6224103.1 rubrerythrin [Desmospora profundinema]
MYSIPHSILQRKRDIGLADKIAKAIDGQYSAIACYGYLASIAPTEEERKQILEIRQDEVRHYQAFSAIYMRLTGRQHHPSITEPCPQQYREGLEFAFKDEQETTDFYLDIAYQATDPAIRNEFLRAAADEQHHAVWFLYFLTKKSCGCKG